MGTDVSHLLHGIEKTEHISKRMNCIWQGSLKGRCLVEFETGSFLENETLSKRFCL